MKYIANGIDVVAVSDKNICGVSKTKAIKQAEQFMLQNADNIMLVEEADIKQVVMYSYVRECDKRLMIAYYCELYNGYAYIKNFYTYCHINKHSEAEYKKFLNDCIDMTDAEVCEITNREDQLKHMNFYTMYRCVESSDWLYTEFSCSHRKLGREEKSKYWHRGE